MNSFSIVLAVGPFAIYCLVLGGLHLRRRPKVVSGSRDLACLGLAMIGLYLIGPAELFFPQAAFNFFGLSVWLALFALYFFLLIFAILHSKPCLIVFGLDAESLVAKVECVLQELDPDTRWLDHTFVSPGLGIEGTIEPAGIGHFSHAIATRREQNLIGWIALRRSLAKSLRNVEIEQRGAGYRWITLGICLLSFIGYTLVSHSTSIAQGIREMLRY